MDTEFLLVVAQCGSLVGQIDHNLDVADALCQQAAEKDADLILFPETQATGYSYRDLRALVEATAEGMSGGIVRRYGEMAIKHRLAVCGGMFERERDLFFNTQVVAFPDGRIEKQRKGVSACSEMGIIALDPIRRVFEWSGCRFGILVCADNALIDAAQQFAALDISLLLHPCAGRIVSSGVEAQAATREEADVAYGVGLSLAEKLDVIYAAANPIGFSGEDFYPGNSWIIDPAGPGLRSPATALPSEMTSSLISYALPKPLLVA